MYHLGQTIPRNYIDTLSVIHEKISQKIIQIVKIVEIIDRTYMKSTEELLDKKLESLPQHNIPESEINILTI